MKKEQTASKKKELQVDDVESTKDFVIKEQTARKELENFRRRSEPLEGDYREFRKTLEIENKEQTARKELETN